MSSRNQKPFTLVVGADSVIGGSLLESLQRSGQPVIGTTRRKETVNQLRPYLDLSEESLNWTDPRQVETAILCAGTTSLEDCRTDPAGSKRINVESTCMLAEQLISQGAFVIFLSSSLVFDGSTPHPSITEPVSPVTEYGSQKAEAERRINQISDSTAIVRFTKILGPKIPLFESWVQTLKNEEVIHPFKDMYFAPVPLFTAVSVLELVCQHRLSGILQVSGERDVSYADSAHVAACLLNVDSGLVQPIKASESGKDLEDVGVFSALNVDRLKSTLGIQPPLISWTLESAFLNPRFLSCSS